MTKPRSSFVSLEDTSWYHCVSRCVRRAFLCGFDSSSGKDFDHRRQWIVDRMKQLTEIYSVHIAGYAIMSNHYHIVLKIDREAVSELTDEEVLSRWKKLYKLPDYRNKRTGIYLLTFLPEFATFYLSGGSHDKAKKQLCFP